MMNAQSAYDQLNAKMEYVCAHCLGRATATDRLTNRGNRYTVICDRGHETDGMPPKWYTTLCKVMKNSEILAIMNESGVAGLEARAAKARSTGELIRSQKRLMSGDSSHITD